MSTTSTPTPTRTASAASLITRVALPVRAAAPVAVLPCDAQMACPHGAYWLIIHPLTGAETACCNRCLASYQRDAAVQVLRPLRS